MKTGNIIKYIAIGSVITVVGLFAYMVYASNMISYLSEDPKVCINCHVMTSHYATWQHSAHRESATCVECHLPQESLVDKMIYKSMDGAKDFAAMTFRTFGKHIKVSDSATKRIQANCIFCHRETVSQMTVNSKLYQENGESTQIDRNCWDCHRKTPHGSTRSLTATPDNIGVKEEP